MPPFGQTRSVKLFAPISENWIWCKIKVSETLDILSEAGLVRRDAGRNPETADLVRQPRYRLKDNYSRFYLKYIEPVKDMIDDGSYDFTSMSSMPEGVSAHTALVYDGNLSPIVEADGYFDAIVSFREVLGL